MKYEAPIIQIIMFETEDVITVSVDDEGTGDGVTGGW